MNNTVSFLSSSDVGEADLELIKIPSESPQRLMTEVISWIKVEENKKEGETDCSTKSKLIREVMYSCHLPVFAGQVGGNR